MSVTLPCLLLIGFLVAAFFAGRMTMAQRYVSATRALLSDLRSLLYELGATPEQLASLDAAVGKEPEEPRRGRQSKRQGRA